MSLQILSTFWNEPHVKQFEDIALRGLLWEKNLAALRKLGAVWNIYTNEEFHSRVLAKIPDNMKVVMGSTRDLMDYIDPFQSAFIKMIKKCLLTGDKLLLMPSDLMFGDGSIHNIWEMGNDPGQVVVVPHVRVLPSLLESVKLSPYWQSSCENWALVNLAFNHLHDSWVFAERGHHNQSSFHGGVEWIKLGENLYSVTHRLPAPFLIDFTSEDLQYFQSSHTLNSLDHQWPGDILIPRGRQVFVGSSDAAFLIEPTEAGKNIPNILPGQPADGRGFHRNGLHNKSNAQFRAIFRGA